MPDAQLTPFFPVGGPVSPRDVVDREAFLEGLEQRLKDRVSVLIPGPRRTGKTTIVSAALANLKEEGFYTALIDLFRITSRRQFAEAMIDACLANRTGINQTVRWIKSRIKGILSGVEVKVGIDDLDVTVSLQNPATSDEDLLKLALDLPQELARRDNRGMIVAFDEFQEAEKLGGGELLKQLRAYFQTHERVSYVFLGSRSSLLRALFTDSSKAFFRFATILELPLIPDSAWIGYLTRKFAERGLAIEEPLVRFILAHSGGHPQDTMAIAAEILYAALETQAHLVTAALVELGHERALMRLQPLFEEIWTSIQRQSPAAAVVLQGLSSGTRPYTLVKDPKTAARALKLLSDQGLIERLGRGEYRFVEPLFAEFLRRL